jgi:hypothetical protein
MFLTLILIAFFPLSAAEQNEINLKNEGRFSLLTFFCTCKESEAAAGRDRQHCNGSGTVPAVKGTVPYFKPAP